MTNVPKHFDLVFLHWFRDCTEETWQRYQTRTFEEFVASQVGGRDWQQGTRWLSGLSEQEIVVIEHRYLLASPCEAGNPVLSIYQSDIIIYGVDLHDYFLTEFGRLIGGGNAYGSQLTQEKYEAYQTIPFWGEFLS